MRRFGVLEVTLAALATAVVLGAVSSTESSPEARSAGGAWRLALPHERAKLAAALASFGTRKHEFYFTRAMYSSGGFGGFGRSWATDYPKGDQQFVAVLQRLIRELDTFGSDHAMRLDDPELRRFPFLYAVEVGRMDLTDSEVRGLRDYLKAGGFLIVDDFWGTYEWMNFAENITRVLPEYAIVDLPLTHPLFHIYYDIKEILQVPYHGRGCSGGPYWEQDGYVPYVKAIFDDKGRMLVLISWNSDLGDAWEWMELACYPLTHSTYAAQLGANTIIYAMSH
ncbi:MAG: DUF4159 domain-containing protein [Longimicrobiales bacterium]